MSEEVNDVFSGMDSLVRFEPSVSIRFLAEEIRRYGIKTNSTNDKGKTIFYQSSHIIMKYDQESDDGIVYPSFALVSFKDLFKIIGKNDQGVDDQDILRVWKIAEKLENRRMINIQGVATELLDSDDKPDLPNVSANVHHIYRNNLIIKSTIFVGFDCFHV